jgi:hypothetical protein
VSMKASARSVRVGAFPFAPRPPVRGGRGLLLPQLFRGRNNVAGRHYSRPHARPGIDRNQSDVVPANRQPSGTCRRRDWRGLLSVLIAVIYLLAGVLHGSHDIDVTTPGGGSEIAAVLDGPSDHSDHWAIGGHHCHGCFSLTVTQPAPAAVTVALASASSPHRAPRLAGIVPDTDSPPPKPIA